MDALYVLVLLAVIFALAMLVRGMGGDNWGPWS